MAISEVSLGAGPTWTPAYWPVTTLSDNALAIAAFVPHGSNWDYVIYTSLDGGATWSSAYTVLTNVAASWHCVWIGNSLYLLYAGEGANVAMTCYRADYTPGFPGTWGLGVNGSQIRAAASGKYFGRPSADREPTGRLWVGYVYFDGSWLYVNASYSDDNGATWNLTTFSSGQQLTTHVNVQCLDLNTILTWVYCSGGGPTETARWASHKHADATNTWTGPTNMSITLTGNGYAGTVFSGKERAAPSKRLWSAVCDSDANPRTISLNCLTEDGGGALTQTNITGANAITGPSGQTGGARVTGLQNGCVVYYVWSGSGTTLRFRTAANGGTAFDAENTFALSYALATINQYLSCSLPHQGAWNVADAVNYACIQENNSGTYSVDAIVQGLPAVVLPPVGIANDLQIEILGTVQLVSTEPVEALGTLNYPIELQIEWEGLWLAIADVLMVLVPWEMSFLDTLTVAAAALADFEDQLTVQAAIAGGDFMDSLRIIRPRLIELHGDDVQLPYAHVTRD